MGGPQGKEENCHPSSCLMNEGANMSSRGQNRSTVALWGLNLQDRGTDEMKVFSVADAG